MSKEAAIAHWVRTAEDDWLTVEVLLSAGRYPQGLFWLHLTIEKLAKALWIKEHDPDVPPFIHSINRLLTTTSLRLTPAQLATAAELDLLQQETRYPDATSTLYDSLNADEATRLWAAATELRQCILSKLP